MSPRAFLRELKGRQGYLHWRTKRVCRQRDVTSEAMIVLVVTAEKARQLLCQ